MHKPDIRLRVEIERTRQGRALVEQRLLTLEMRQAPMPMGPATARFWSRQTLVRLFELVIAIIQNLPGILHLCRHAERGF